MTRHFTAAEWAIAYRIARSNAMFVEWVEIAPDLASLEHLPIIDRECILALAWAVWEGRNYRNIPARCLERLRSSVRRLADRNRQLRTALNQ